jgi:predicted ATPase/DNA-binding SARP family transcriptional activator
LEKYGRYAAVVEFGVLGPLQVKSGGREVEIRGGISRTLLAAQDLRVSETVSADALIDLVWNDDLPRNPSNALQIQVSYLRKTLSSAEAADQQPIVTRPGGYALEVARESVDAVTFERLFRAANSIDGSRSEVEAQRALHTLDEGLALWRGDAFADLAGSLISQGAAIRLEEMRWSAHELRNDLLLRLGRHRDVVGELSSQLAAQPLRERLHEQLITALYRCGRQAEALRAFDLAREVLVGELGVDPGPALQQLHHQVLAQAPELDWAAPPATRGGNAARPLPAEWRRNYVPAPMTPLIGREADLARVGDLMGRTRLVTLTGPGGAGKTRLAIDLAARHALDAHVWYVDLSAIDLPELVAPSVAAAIGATTGPAEDPVEVVASALAADAGLLVLDTCEHVLVGAASIASAVLRRAPGLRILATSRRPLAIAGEAAWPVPPLAVALPEEDSLDEIRASPAVALFCQRAQAVRPDFALTNDNAAAVAGICLALDGLPLAIELAAARADVLTAEDIRRRLENRFELLVEGSADAAVRQQTLRGAIDWSMDLLSGDQRQFFARLGAFAGGFELDAADAVAGWDADDALALLSALVRHSMVVRDEIGRFRLLDTLRAYAEDLLADLDADATRRRHALYFTSLAERSEPLVRGHEQKEALARLRREIPNFRAALEWSLTVGDLEIASRLAGSLAWFWALDGRLDVADRHLRRAIAIDTVPPATRSKVLWGYALLVAGLGDIDQALDAGQASVTLARQSGDDAAIGAALNAIAVAQWALGDLNASTTAHDEAIERFIAARDLWGEAICRVLRARTALDRGDADAEHRLREGLDAARRCGDVHVVGIAQGLLAEVHADRGELDDAVRLAAESLALQESIGYAEGTVSALHLLARLHTEAGDDEEARGMLLRGLRLGWKMQHAAAVCEALEDLAQIEGRSGDRDQALQLLTAADAERARRNLPLRSGDRQLVDKLRAQIGLSSDRLPSREVASVVAELLA